MKSGPQALHYPHGAYMTHATPLPAWCEFRVWLSWCSACGLGHTVASEKRPAWGVLATLREITCLNHGSLTRYAILRVAHAPGMPGTFSPPPWVSDPGMHQGLCVTHVPWCIPGSLTSGFPWSRGGNVPGILCACATRHFAYLVRGPFTPGSVAVILTV